MAGVLSILNENTRHLRQLYNEKGIGSSHGWLIMVDDQTSSIYAVNPLKLSTHIELPSLLSYPGMLDDDVYWSFFPETDKNTCVKRIVFSKNPTQEGCVAVGVFGELKKLAYCKVGDEKWTMISNQEETIIRAYKDVFDEAVDFLQFFLMQLSATELFELVRFCSMD